MLWTKDNGQEIETNDLPATIEGCKAMGWIPAEIDKPEVKKAAPKKKAAAK